MTTPRELGAGSSQTIPATGVLLLVGICLLWGGNIVSIKFSNQGIPPVLAATLRSTVASALLWLYARSRGESVFLCGPDLKHALILGALFAVDFILLYLGPVYTDASRAVIFLYTQPLWVAFGAHLILPDDRLSPAKAAGLGLSFCGLLAVFGSRSEGLGPYFWVGDLMEVGAAMAWAACTVYIKKFVWNRKITHYQTLFSQLFYSIPLMLVCSLVLEWNTEVRLDAPVITAFLYQTVVVAFFSYVLWFWMIHAFTISRLAAFTFLAPLFGVILSGLLLKEPLPLLLWAGLGLVASGIYLVNRPQRK